MEQRKTRLLGHLVPAALALLSAGGCGDGDTGLGEQRQNLTVECLGQDAPVPADAWLCPAPRTVDCSALASLPPLYVRDETNPSCTASLLEAQVSSELRPGATYPVRVTRDDGSLACETAVRVTDAVAPVLTPKSIKLWPPNHKLHTIAVEDCVAVSDSCERDLQAEFVWASSDEPIDSIGDGHHAPDIVIDSCRRVQVRAERQGPKDGRVYKLGVRVVDAAGNASESACTIIVDHDQRGVTGADSGEKYRIAFNGQNGLPSCDGDDPPPPPANNDAGTPPVPDAGTPPVPDAGSDPVGL